MEEARAEPQPFVSVVVPVRDEERWIGALLASLLEQDYPPERFEIIVADGISRDGTRRMIAEVASRRAGTSPAIVVVDNPAQTAPGGLNRAIERARGDVIVRLDGHAVASPHHLSRCVDLLRETGADNVGGPITTLPGATGRLARAVAIAMSAPFGVGGAAFRTSDARRWVDTVPFGAWPRSVFDRLGGFDEELRRNQDDELNFRIVQSGGRIWLDPQLRTDYRARAGLGGLGRQYFDYGMYKVRVMQKRRGVAAARHLVPPALVAALVGAAGLSWVRRSPRPLLGVVVPYGAATSVAAVIEGRRDPGVTPLLPAAFATLHLSYGAGVLAGLWRFRRGFGRGATPPP